jgi:hypothetical protein
MHLSMTSKVALAALVWSLSTVAGWPQQTDQQPANQPSGPGPAAPEQPAAPAPPPGNSAPLGTSGVPAPQGESTGTPAETPAPVDTRSLAGAEAITPALPGGGRSYVLPSFSVWQAADTNSQIIPGASKVQFATIPTASLSLNDVGRRNLFSLDYQGGAMIYDTDSNLTTAFQTFGFADKYTVARWNLMIADHLSYLPQASLGFGGFGFAGTFSAQSLGLGNLGSGIALNSLYTPQQSVLTGQAGTTTNTAVAQAQYNFSPRSSLTAVGSFGIVHYTQAGLSSGNDTFLTLSYDHRVTSFDTFSVSYSFAALRFNGGSVAINDNLLRLGYAHRITNRLTATVLAGPEYTESAITGFSGVQRRWSWTGQATLGYKVERGSLSADYSHYVTPGSGVFNGAVTDIVGGGFNREVSRTWNASLNAGYSRNTPLGAYSINGNFLNPGRFDYEYGSFRLDRTFGHFARGFFVYNLQREESGAVFIPGANGRVIIRHIFGIGLELHPRPWPI